METKFHSQLNYHSNNSERKATRTKTDEMRFCVEAKLVRYQLRALSGVISVTRYLTSCKMKHEEQGPIRYVPINFIFPNRKDVALK